MSEAHPLDEIRKLEPAALKVTLSDGSERPVAVPKIRNRWQRVYQTMDALPWVRVEALDKNGAILGVVEDDEADELAAEVGAGDPLDGMARMARIMLEVMRSTQRETRQMFEAQMRGNAELVEALITSMRSIASSYETSMQVERATRVAESAQGGNPEIMHMLQLALASGMVGGSKAAAPSMKPEGKP